MTVDDIAAAIFRQLCDHQRAQGPGASLSLTELQLAIGVTEADLMDAVRILRLSDDLYIAFTSGHERVALGPSWRGRCEDEGGAR